MESQLKSHGILLAGHSDIFALMCSAVTRGCYNGSDHLSLALSSVLVIPFPIRHIRSKKHKFAELILVSLCLLAAGCFCLLRESLITIQKRHWRTVNRVMSGRQDAISILLKRQSVAMAIVECK